MSAGYTSRLPAVESQIDDKASAWLESAGEDIANKAERIARSSGIKYTHSEDSSAMTVRIGSADKDAIKAEYGSGEYARGKGTRPVRPLTKALSQAKDKLGESLGKALKETG